MPWALEGPVVRLSVAPLILMRIPFTGLPFCVTRIVSVVLRPTKSVFGPTRTAVQKRTGGVNGPCTTTEAEAVLLAVFVSCSLPTVVAVFVTVPVALAVVTSVIVTDEPTAMFPSWQLTTAPPVQVPTEEVTETNVVPAGIGSATVTPVAPFGPLFVTTIVLVLWLPSVAGFGAPVLVIARSIFGAGTTGGGGGGGIALTVTAAVSVAVTSGPTGG